MSVCVISYFLLTQIFQCHLSIIIGQNHTSIFSSEVKKSCIGSLCPSLRSYNYYLFYMRDFFLLLCQLRINYKCNIYHLANTEYAKRIRLLK